MTPRKLLFTSGAGISLLCVVLSILPFWNVDYWWVRVWDFPRVQLILLGLLGLLIMGIGRAVGYVTYKRLMLPVIVVTLGVVGFQGYRIIPYTKLWPVEVVQTDHADKNDCFSVLVANVLMSNTDTEKIARSIRLQLPDIVLILENDRRWSEALKPLKDRYAITVDRPIDNTYGILFMTGFEDAEVVIREMVEPGIPSVKAVVTLPTGKQFTFYGMHPKPPHVGQDTDQRDVELMRLAYEMKDAKGAAVVGGDLNDVAWSHTTRLFKRITAVLDPRIGRGLFPSFHADYPILRWPLDHIFHTEEFELLSLEVLPDIGSDHFPVLAKLCYVGELREQNETPDPMDEDDQEEMEETISGGLESGT